MDLVEREAHLPWDQQLQLLTLALCLLDIILALLNCGEEVVMALSKIATIPAFHMDFLRRLNEGTQFREVAVTSLLGLVKVDPIWTRRLAEFPDWRAILERQAVSGYLRMATSNIFYHVRRDVGPSGSGSMDRYTSDVLLLSAANFMLKNPNDGFHRSVQQIANVQIMCLDVMASVADSYAEEDVEVATANGAENAVAAAAANRDEPVVGAVKEDSNMDEPSEDLPPGSPPNLHGDDVKRWRVFQSMVSSIVPSVLRFMSGLQLDGSLSRTVYAYALLVLNNISCAIFSVSSASTSALAEALQKSWTPWAKQIWDDVIAWRLRFGAASFTVTKGLVALTWPVINSFSGEVPLRWNEHVNLMAIYRDTTRVFLRGQTWPSHDGDTDQVEDALEMGLCCISVLGILARRRRRVGANAQIGRFLISLLHALPGTPAVHALEALDQLFEIYADRSYTSDRVFWRDGFLHELESAFHGNVRGKLRAMAQGIDETKEPGLRQAAFLAVIELDRFCRYKRHEQEESNPADVFFSRSSVDPYGG